jgi:hypothetical protein
MVSRKVSRKNIPNIAESARTGRKMPPADMACPSGLKIAYLAPEQLRAAATKPAAPFAEAAAADREVDRALWFRQSCPHL